ncbi:MAG: YezD family protein [Candidatus Omnitrophota bacterium]|nr:YezD family protein [Candidatus Omnitrophota bacterium]
MATAKNVNNKMSINETILKNIFALVKDLKFGEIIIKVQDSCIVSVERHEKIRLKKADSKIGEAKVKN